MVENILVYKTIYTPKIRPSKLCSNNDARMVSELIPFRCCTSPKHISAFNVVWRVHCYGVGKVAGDFVCVDFGHCFAI